VQVQSQIHDHHPGQRFFHALYHPAMTITSLLDYKSLCCTRLRDTLRLLVTMRSRSLGSGRPLASGLDLHPQGHSQSQRYL
jgi:hypothetical protein